MALIFKSEFVLFRRSIHSASNFVVGLAGARAAKALGIPSIYEIRGFWHLTQSTKREGYEGSDHYKLTERLEIETAKESDYVFTITKALKDICNDHNIKDRQRNIKRLGDILAKKNKVAYEKGYKRNDTKDLKALRETIERFFSWTYNNFELFKMLRKEN